MNTFLFKAFVIILFLSLNESFCAPTTYTSLTTGDWDTGATWDNGVPAMGNQDVIIISTGHTVTKTGDLATNNNGNVFHIYGSLIINGTLDVKNNLVFNIYSGGSLIITNLLADQNADLTITGGGTATITNDMTFGNNANVIVDGSLTVDGDLTVGSGTLSGDGTVSVGGSCTDDGSGSFCSSGPLPVELLNFNAKSSQNQVFLTWSTASEINNDYFTLEKSKNGRDFVGMGTVTGNGTTNILSNYSFTDNSPYLGLSYYRLSQTDYDGTTEVFPIISVLFTNTTTNFSISPNPVSSPSVKLKVSGKAKHELLELNIMDLQGRLVEHTYFKADDYGNVETEFQLKKQLRKGTYIFELVSGNQKEYLKVIGN